MPNKTPDSTPEAQDAPSADHTPKSGSTPRGLSRRLTSVYGALKSCDEITPYLDDVNGLRSWEGPTEDMVTAVFHWSHGGDEVYLLCDEEGEARRIRMSRNGNSFILVRDVPREMYSYAFVVDGVVRCAPDQPTEETPDGPKNVMDCFNVTPIESTFDLEQVDPNGGEYGHNMPSSSYLSHEPPVVPNAMLYRSPDFDNSHRIGNDLHVMANHVYHDTKSRKAFGPNYNSYINIHCWETSTAEVSLARKWVCV
ncbi:5'-AMP-activated protein kinase subunit beta-1 family protein, putative [Babesia caballi]|uniref:5'-AMP-activated protein kinase subunit beta-1 family protein, putative n=1 Tax=Babesia caballi TaxID=5871 RepID=A0AAV4M1F6_BABCB|nr:5'-AMP-activated protein kinase subunit beta-1 family protein, putative [Babesia caballi]